MPKRGGENRQLRPSELEALEGADSPAAGIFEMADADTIKTRRIVRSKRKSSSKRSRTKAAALGNESAGMPGKNIFAGFQGLTGSNDWAPAAPSMPSLSSFADNGVAKSQDSLDARTPETVDHSAFIEKRRRLNASFHKWICRQMKSNEYSDWTIGVQDYISHMKRLKAKRDSPASSKSSGMVASSASSSRTSETCTNAAPAAKSDANTDKSDVGGDDSPNADGETKKYEVRAKYFEFDKEAKQFKTKGLGDLRIMQDVATKKSRILLFDDCKRLKVNLNLYSGITYKITGKKKNNISFVIVTPDGPTSSMLRVKTGQMAVELMTALRDSSN